MELIDLFCGGGLASRSFQDLGLKVLAGVDVSLSACQAYQTNFSKAVVFKQKVSDAVSHLVSIASSDYLLHLSPPCQSFSAAANIRKSRVRPTISLEIDACVEIIKQTNPLLISLEEVPQFSKSPDAERLRFALWRLGYFTNETVLDCSKIGLPQSRKRLIWRVVRGDMASKLLQAGAVLEPGLFGQRLWSGLEPQQQPHGGWYKAIADLLENEPESQLAEWQTRMVLKAVDFGVWNESSLPVLLPRAGANLKSPSVRLSIEPSPTVRALELSRTWRLFDALLACFQGKECYLRSSYEATIAIAASQQKRSWKVLLQQGELKVKALSPRAIARLQGVSDSYQLVGTKSQQVTVLGNGVPPLLVKKMWQPILDILG